MKDTAINNSQRFFENLLISLAIQEAINEKAIRASEAEKMVINEMIVQLAKHFEPIEA